MGVIRSSPTPQDGAARIRIVLVPRASGKSLRRTDLARGTPSGTMLRNRAAHIYIRLFGKGALCYVQPPGPVGSLFVYLGPEPTAC